MCGQLRPVRGAGPGPSHRHLRRHAGIRDRWDAARQRRRLDRHARPHPGLSGRCAVLRGHTTFWVNNNGNITFRGPVGTFTPSPFPIAMQPMIAPYWGDVDTRGGGTPDRNYVAWHVAPGLLAVTWHNVGYFSIHDDLRMDFQMILRNALDCGSGDFDVEFRYHECGWTTGDASGGRGGFGGTPAQSGFDAGNMTDFVEIPGSRTMSILDLCTTSNVGEPGIWRFAVRGGTIVCPGAGEPCDSGGMGACGLGLTACIGREVRCVAVGSASPESCDNIDNDCNGMVDDGSGLCPATQVCVTGVCVPPCFEGACGEGETCDAAGGCVETACIGVTCGPGERCAGGVCVDGCAGIVCPRGQQCFAGRCVDLCNILECGSDEICVDGECVPTCPCRPCGEDEICGADGSCTTIGCDITICDPGTYCGIGELGAAECLDACAGAVCPAGQRCETGNCVAIPPAPDAGPPTVPDGGLGVVDAGGAAGVDAGDRRDGGAGRRPGGVEGCRCRAGAGRPDGAMAVLVLLGLSMSLRRRRGGAR
ncbi:MAG: nidogen-like domain-containing protein [Deltaproteobacteria bacterium]